MRFSAKIVLLIAVLIAMGGVVQTIAFNRFFLATADSILLATNEKAANNTAESLYVYFNKIKNSLKTVASDPRIRENQEILDKVNDIIPEINAIFILDTHGRIRLASGAEYDPNRDFSQREYFQHAIRGETCVTDVFTSSINRQVVAVATPIVENGLITGVVVGTVRLHNNDLASMFDNKSFGRKGNIAVTDAQGIVVYHTDRSRIGNKGVMLDRLTGITGSVITENYTGQEQYVGYSRVPELNWLVTVYTPTAQIKELRATMIYHILAISVVTLGMLVAIGIYALRRYTKPFERLMLEFGAIRKGTYNEISPQDYPDEYDAVIAAYNHSVRKLREVHSKLQGDADIDGLTGAYNRRSFDQTVDSLTAELQAGLLTNLGVMFIDLDNYKEINDTKGHLIGDDMLREFTVLAMSVVEPRSLFRYGGDEFIVVLRNTEREKVLAVAEQLRNQCATVLEGCTISIGVATYPENAASVVELFALADKALYLSKTTKNTITGYPPPS